jgi:hypothetical protein
MADWKKLLNADPTDWLLEHDESQPAIRYYTLRDILGQDENDKEVKAAKAAIMKSGPVPLILRDQNPKGYWGKPPGYTGTSSAMIFLAQFGAEEKDPRIRAGCDLLLSKYIDSHGAPLGGLSLRRPPSGFSYCELSPMVEALINFGRLEDQRLQTSIAWLAKAITERGATSKSHGKTETLPFACSGRNAGLPCAWGTIKTLIALSKVPPEQRSKNVQEAIRLGVDFLLSCDPASADYPFGVGNKPSSTWFKFYYPLRSEADVLQNLEVLVALGQAKNPRLANAFDLVVSKQNQQGRWRLERNYKNLPDTHGMKVPYWYHNSLKLYLSSKELEEIQEKKGQPSKWVTLRAMRVLKQAANTR